MPDTHYPSMNLKFPTPHFPGEEQPTARSHAAGCVKIGRVNLNQVCRLPGRAVPTPHSSPQGDVPASNCTTSLERRWCPRHRATEPALEVTFKGSSPNTFIFQMNK